MAYDKHQAFDIFWLLKNLSTSYAQITHMEKLGLLIMLFCQ